MALFPKKNTPPVIEEKNVVTENIGADENSAPNIPFPTIYTGKFLLMKLLPNDEVLLNVICTQKVTLLEDTEAKREDFVGRTIKVQYEGNPQNPFEMTLHSIKKLELAD